MALTTSVEAAAGRVPITIVSLDGELDASNFERLVDEMGAAVCRRDPQPPARSDEPDLPGELRSRRAQLDRADHARPAADRPGVGLGRAPRARQRRRRWDRPRPRSSWPVPSRPSSASSSGRASTGCSTSTPTGPPRSKRSERPVGADDRRTARRRPAADRSSRHSTAPRDGSGGTGISLAIEDLDGRVLAAAGAPGTRGTAIEVHRTIDAGGRAIGRVVGRGTTDRALLEAIVASLAAGLAVARRAVGRDDRPLGCRGRHRGPARGRAGARAADPAKPHPARPAAIPGYEVASHYEAAREVGGDFFDVFRVRGRAGRVAICIADVTGKGVAAALLMAFTRPLLRAAVDHLRTPGGALEQTNRILVDERRSALFITALCATVELRRGIVRLANAGHEPPAPRPGRRRADQLAGRQRAAPGGLRPAGPRRAGRSSWRPATSSCFYTDGVTDAQAPSGLRFGDDRLIEALESARGGTASDAVEAVVRRLPPVPGGPAQRG